MLVYSVLRFRHFVKTFLFAVPKRRLMVFHFFNVFIYSTLYIVSAILYINYVKTKQNDTTLAAQKAYFWFVICIGFQGIFQVYNVIFIYVLLLK